MMARLEFERTMRSFLDLNPFQPFLIEYDDGEQFLSLTRKNISYWIGDSAIYFGPDGAMAFVDCDDVKQILAITSSPAGSAASA